MKKIILFHIGLFFILTTSLNAQIFFTVELQENNTTYLVKMRSERSFKRPMSITNSIQCSLVAPQTGFKVSNLKGITGKWTNENSLEYADDNEQCDFLVFNLQGHLTDIEYVKGEEIPLFSFENVGEATEKVFFVKEKEITLLKNKNLNIGNQVSILGAGYKNAYSGTYGDAINLATPLVQEEAIPNPTQSKDTYKEVSANVFDLGTRIKNQLIHLEWIAGQIAETRQFVIEKSLDGYTFSPIQELPINENYHFSSVDKAPDFGTNYYRIKQVFDSGEHRYSPIKEEKYFIDEHSITLYPNPVVSDFRLNIGHFTDLEGSVHIFNASGVEMANKSLTAERKELQFDATSFPNGLYFLIIQTESTQIFERQFVVEHNR